MVASHWRIYGHRGAPIEAPENTLAAFRQARLAGADGVELDLQLTADGHVVVIHDGILDRTTSGSGNVAAHTLAQLRALSAGCWFAQAFAGERIPTLDEVLDLAQGLGLALDLELKAGPGGDALAQAVARALVARGFGGADAASPVPLFVTSFDAGLIEHVGRCTGLPVGYLLGLGPADAAARRAWALAGLATAHRAGARVVLPRLDALLADPEAWDQPLSVLPWMGPWPHPVPAALDRHPRVIGVITDEPARAVAHRAARTAGPQP